MIRFKKMLTTLLENRGCFSDEEKIAYMSDLKPIARNLWRSYQSDDIEISYDDPDVQLVYMTRYFPFYTQVLRREFERLIRSGVELRSAFKNNPLVITLFCSGPLPEAVGFAQFIEDNRIKPHNLVINVCDLYSDEWAGCRDVATGLIMDHLPKVTKF